jgi:hypothetical protein
MMEKTRKSSAVAPVVVTEPKSNTLFIKEKEEEAEELRSLRAEVDHLKGENHILYQ